MVYREEEGLWHATEEGKAGGLSPELVEEPDRRKKPPRKLPPPQQHGPPGLSYANDEAAKVDRLRIWSCRTPHYLAFHLSWLSFLVAFMAWFSAAPLMPVIRHSLGLTRRQVALANLASVSTAIFIRVIMGPITDFLGPKRALTWVLVIGAVPVLMSGFIRSFTDLVVVRACAGLLSACFVMVQCWSTLMFQAKVVGTANAFVAGWGNQGGGITQVMMVSVFSALRKVGYQEEEAWRHAFVLPSFLLVVAAGAVLGLGTDCPKGDFRDLRKRGLIGSMPHRSMLSAARSIPTWILALQYALTFGSEVTIYNTATSYFTQTFQMDPVQAGQLATLCGVTNIVSRASGGWASDQAFRRFGVKGRVVVHFLLVVSAGLLVLLGACSSAVGPATGFLVAFCFLVQAANGSCFSLVPSVSEHVGSVAGMVGAGGSVGAVAFALLFLLGEYEEAQGLKVMGATLLACSPVIFLLPSTITTKPPPPAQPPLAASLSIVTMDESSSSRDSRLAIP